LLTCGHLARNLTEPARRRCSRDSRSRIRSPRRCRRGARCAPSAWRPASACIMALLAPRGFDTPSLSAQGGQRRFPFLNSDRDNSD
jgi:hypothetical protein